MDITLWSNLLEVSPSGLGINFGPCVVFLGICYNFDLYCGKSASEDNRAGLLLGSKVVLNMLDIVEEPQSHTVFFDNLFTGYELLVYLCELGFQATGTLLEKRLKKCLLMEAKEMKKQKRGTYSSRFDTNEEILFVRWLDNTAVTIGTNYDTVEPLQKVKTLYQAI